MNEQTSQNVNSGTVGKKNNEKPRHPLKKRPVWIKILRGMLWVIACLTAVVLIAITIAVSYLKPERLTPLVEKYANEYLVNADINIGRIEISFWHTFPRFELDITDLSVKSNALSTLPHDSVAGMQVWADSLLTLHRFNGAINIPKLLAGNITLYDIILDRPEINIVQATPQRSNLDIFPESKKEDENNETSVFISDLSFATFEIRNGMSVRYLSVPDSTDISITLSDTRLNGNNAPDYSVDIHGLTSASVSDFSIKNLSFGIGGDIRWSQYAPQKLALNNFKISAGKVNTTLSTDINFAEGLRIDRFNFLLPRTPASDIMELIPEEMRGETANLKAGFDMKLGIELTQPFRPAVDSIPSVNVTLEIPEGRADYEQLHLSRFALLAKAEINGEKLDASTINVEKLLAIGQGVGFELNGKIDHIISDPAISGTFKGGVEISRLPKKLLAELPCEIDGSLRADSKFSLRKSYLDQNNFHRIRLTGEATLRNLKISMPELPAELYSRTMELKLGTNSSFTRGDISVDSLLTASLKIDTISAGITGMILQASEVKMGVGCQNTSSSADTSIINPIGGRIVADRLLFRSTEDSTRIRLRKSTVGATLRRYKDDKTKPQLVLNVATDGAFYGDRLNRALLGKLLLLVTAYPSAVTQRPRRSPLIDSLSVANPDLPQDSLRAMARAIRRARMKTLSASDSVAVAEGEVIDISVDNSMRRLLRRWDARGVLKSERMRVFTPYFPLRNTLSDLNIRFNSDSLTITDTRLRTGHTSLVMNGSVSNIKKALTSINHQQPLRLDFTLDGDTIEVNEIAGAVFAGAAFAESDTTGIFIAQESDNERAMQSSVETNASDTMATLVIPSNVEANINVKANNIAYSNLMFRDFKGRLNVYKGAINLEQLTAATNVGGIDLNALYSAPSKEDASFAFGLGIKDFHIKQFLELVPAIDSLMPLLYGIDGIINANIAATTRISDGMNIDIPTLKAALKLSGDSLVLIDEATFKKIGKWLMFKHKEKNVIDSMNVEMIVQNSQLEMFPFIFDIDRYRLGVMGTNDMAMNLKYHIAVLKSPLPFKFGINISGNVDDMKIRLGKAKFNEKNMPKSVAIADTTRINLVREIGNIFRRGVRDANIGSLDFSGLPDSGTADSSTTDTISRRDSLYFIREGLIAPPDTTTHASIIPETKKTKNKKAKK